MINLRTMKRFFDHVDEHGRGTLIDALAALWDADPGSAQVIHASSNFTATFTTRGQRRSLRAVPVSERPEVILKAELAFIRHLASRGVPVALPQSSQSGRLVEQTDSPVGPLHVTAWIWLEGHCHEEPEDADAKTLRVWGRSLGCLHAAARGYSAPGRPDMNTLIDEAVARLPSTALQARKAAALLVEEMSHWERSPETYGLIHFDLSIDNLIIGEGEPGIIDFDDCAYGWFGADIAFALRHCFEDRIAGIDPGDPRLNHFLSGYREVRPVPDNTLERLPHFLAMNHLHHLGNLHTCLEAESSHEDPAWIAHLRQKLQFKCDAFREDLAHYCVSR